MNTEIIHKLQDCLTNLPIEKARLFAGIEG